LIQLTTILDAKMVFNGFFDFSRTTCHARGCTAQLNEVLANLLTNKKEYKATENQYKFNIEISE
jgi:hypothetical protein